MWRTLSFFFCLGLLHVALNCGLLNLVCKLCSLKMGIVYPKAPIITLQDVLFSFIDPPFYNDFEKGKNIPNKFKTSKECVVIKHNSTGCERSMLFLPKKNGIPFRINRSI